MSVEVLDDRVLERYYIIFKEDLSEEVSRDNYTDLEECRKSRRRRRPRNSPNQPHKWTPSQQVT
jgi:hypothetical protein